MIEASAALRKAHFPVKLYTSPLLQQSIVSSGDGERQYRASGLKLVILMVHWNTIRMANAVAHCRAEIALSFTNLDSGRLFDLGH